MNINPGKTEFSDAEHEALRMDIRRARDNGISQADLARQADVAESTLSQYLGGKYNSEPGKTDVAVKLNRWLRAQAAEAELRRRLPQKPTYQPLAGSTSIRTALAYARETGRLVMIAGVPGVSKTATARQFREDFPHTWYAAMDPSTGGVPTMLLEVLAAMGVTDAKGTPQVLMRQVCSRASAVKGLLIVDEAQHLSEKAVEALRAINDRIQLGIALMGNNEAHQRVGPTGVKEAFAQVSSRFAHRRFIVAPDQADAATLARAWAETNDEVIGKAEIAFCQQIAAKPGGLRNIEMTMEGALISARGAQEPLTLEHLQGAFAQLSGVVQGR